MIPELRVSDIMTRHVISVGPETTLAAIAKVMIDNDIGCVLVMEENKPIGIITERDIVKAVSQKQNPLKVKAKDIMSSPLITITPDATISEASRKMAKHKIERLPVMLGNKLVGIITTRDIIKVSPEADEIIKEYIKIRLGEYEAEAGRAETLEGICELCGNYSDNLKEVNGRLLCEECREEEK